MGDSKFFPQEKAPTKISVVQKRANVFKFITTCRFITIKNTLKLISAIKILLKLHVPAGYCGA